MLAFDQEPPYDYILSSLQHCFEKAVAMNTPIGPPSCAAALSQRVDQDIYVFEWNRTLANRVRNALLAEKNQLQNVVEVALSPSLSYQPSIQSRDINFSSGGRVSSLNNSHRENKRQQNSS